jgi:hypothetical protein
MKAGIRLWRLWLGGVLGLWLVAFLVVPEPPASAPLARPAERWELPDVPDRANLAGAAGAMATSLLWSRPTLTGAAAAAPRQARVIVRFAAPDKRPQTLSVGDALPDGSKIESIEASRVCVTRERRRECLPVPAKTPRDF